VGLSTSWSYVCVLLLQGRAQFGGRGRGGPFGAGGKVKTQELSCTLEELYKGCVKRVTVSG
jgi:hypothetical protein